MSVNVLCVVEDDTDMQRLIELVLESDPRLKIAGCAATAEAAVALARATQPALIVLDHFIDGEVMGLESAPMLKVAAPKACILLFTSHDLRLEAEREPAIDEYLSKGDLHDLLPTIQRLLGMEPVAA